MNNTINYSLVLIGSIIAIYAKATEEQDLVVLIFGIIILMFGIYRIASKIPSKHDKNLDDNNDNQL